MSDVDAASGRGREATALPERVLVGTDGSPTATQAVRRAATLAKLFGAELRVLSAHREASRGGLWAGATPPDQNWLATASAAAQQVAEKAALDTRARRTMSATVTSLKPVAATAAMTARSKRSRCAARTSSAGSPLLPLGSPGSPS